jgi:hypothetical protein
MIIIFQRDLDLPYPIIKIDGDDLLATAVSTRGQPPVTGHVPGLLSTHVNDRYVLQVPANQQAAIYKRAVFL